MPSDALPSDAFSPAVRVHGPKRAGPAAATATGMEIRLANLGAATGAFRLPTPPAAGYVLDADRFVAAAADPRAFDGGPARLAGELTHDGFAVARLVLG